MAVSIRRAGGHTCVCVWVGNSFGVLRETDKQRPAEYVMITCAYILIRMIMFGPWKHHVPCRDYYMLGHLFSAWFCFPSCIVFFYRLSLAQTEKECQQSAMGFLPYFPHLFFSFMPSMNFEPSSPTTTPVICVFQNNIFFLLWHSFYWGKFFSILFFDHKFISTKKEKIN